MFKKIDTADEKSYNEWTKEFLKGKSYIDNGPGSFTLY